MASLRFGVNVFKKIKQPSEAGLSNWQLSPVERQQFLQWSFPYSATLSSSRKMCCLYFPVQLSLSIENFSAILLWKPRYLLATEHLQAVQFQQLESSTWLTFALLHILRAGFLPSGIFTNYMAMYLLVSHVAGAGVWIWSLIFVCFFNISLWYWWGCI